MGIISGIYMVIFMFLGFAFYGAIAIGVASSIIDCGKECISKWKN